MPGLGTVNRLYQALVQHWPLSVVLPTSRYTAQQPTQPGVSRQEAAGRRQQAGGSRQEAAQTPIRRQTVLVLGHPTFCNQYFALIVRSLWGARIFTAEMSRRGRNRKSEIAMS